MNKVILIGFVGNDPEERGANVVSFRLATTERGYTKANGEIVADRTEWHNITIFQEAQRGFVKSHVRKGASVLVEGKIHYSSYQDANGARRDGVEIIASSVSFFYIGGKKEKEQQQGNEDVIPASSNEDLPF